MTSPLEPSALNSSSPTSRSVFRLIVRGAGCTNREADALRLVLLDFWKEHAGVDELGRQLRAFDKADPKGDQGWEPRLGIWFGLSERPSGETIEDDDPLLSGVSPEFGANVARALRELQS